MIDPRGMTAADWTAQTTPILVQFGSIPLLMDETDWRNWAASVIALPAITAIGVPLPEGFDDWQSWAFRFNQAVGLLPNT